MTRMRLLVVVLLAGCSHATIDVGANTSAGSVVPSAGTTVTSGTAGLHIQSPALAAVVITGMVMAAALDDARQERPFPSFSLFSDWFRGTPAPELAAGRRISEQDCSRPIDPSLGNLRCR
jgi:hypothetical protein